MPHPLASLSESSKVWVYLADRSLSPAEQASFLDAAARFIDGWAAHNMPLTGGVEVWNDMLVVVAVDERYTGASGCSIDKLQAFMVGQEKQLGLRFLDRMRVAFKQDQSWNNISVTEFKALVEAQKIHADTIVLNTLFNQLGEALKGTEIPVSQSWLSRYLIKTQA